MSTVDVKSLFKSGKKPIKAFKVATGPIVETTPEKSADETMEQWEAPAVSQSVVAAPGNVDLNDYKGEEEQQNLKPSVSWKSEKELAAEVVAAPVPVSTSAYKPPSHRRVDNNVALPSLSEAVKVAATAPARSVSAVSSSAGGRPKFINAATKKAMEEEEKQKEFDKLEREKEKLARKEQLKAELLEPSKSVVPVVSSVIQAASISEIYSKYIDRPKIGRA